MLDALKNKITAGEPITGGGAGTGITAKREEAGGIDLIAFYNSGRFSIVGLALLLFSILPLPKTWSQCGSEPFPDQWSVHPLQSSELPYRSVHIYANTDIDGDGRKDIVTGGWWYKNPGSASGNWLRKNNRRLFS